MPTTPDLSQVNKVKFHHRVKNFYYKNLFRKIYTVAIIWLIAANVFSLFKYQSFANEYDTLQPVSQDSEWLDTAWLQNADIVYYDVAGNQKAIMAKNLWATSSNINSPDSYGDFYQWWNDYAYPRYVDSEFCDLDELDEYWNGRCPLSGFIEPVLLPEPPVSLSAHSIDDSNPTPSDYDRFNDYWVSEEENDGWYWWDEWEQWPCPDWYYIPTANEWSNLFVQRCEDSDICDTRDLVVIDWYYWMLGNWWISEESLWNWEGTNNIKMDMIVNAFMQEYKLPLAGWRDNNQVNGSNFNSAYWSSTFWNWEYDPTYLNLWPSNWAGVMKGDGYYGSSIRCVAGEYDVEKDPIPLAIDLYLGEESPTDEVRSLSISSLNIDPDWWMWRIFIPAGEPVSASKIAKLDIGYTWYTEYGYEIDLDSDEWSGGISLELYEQFADPDTHTLHLYWVPSCGDDEQYVNWICEPVKWWTTVNEQWDYECLAEWATYDKASWQCVYTAKNINGNTITLMSSNLGATELNPMWDFYQWGNDWRYPRDEILEWYHARSLWIQTINNTDQTDFDRFSEYYSYDGYTWNGDDNKQWPCPTWYHVPTIYEWSNLFLQWCEDSDICDTRNIYNSQEWRIFSFSNPLEDKSINSLGNWFGDNPWDVMEIFIQDYGLLLAGRRETSSIYDFGSIGNYWSSTPSFLEKDAFRFYIDPSYRSKTDSSAGWSNGYSVRCFKDSNDESLQAVALDLYLAQSLEDMSLNVQGIYTTEDMIWRIFVPNGHTIPSFKKSGLDQYSWYMLDNGELKEINIDNTTFSVDADKEPVIPLFALPKCDEDEEWDITTSTCRKACLWEWATYDAEANLCYYTAHDLEWNTIKVMDSNLGATRANPMWDFFQWWNDYPYPRFTNYGCSQEGGYCPLDQWSQQESLSTQWIINDDGLYDYERFNNYYKQDEDGDCIEDENWFCILQDEYVWKEWAQWPCPDDYHVPTIDEWWNIFIAWCEKNDECDTREMINYWQYRGMKWLIDGIFLYSSDFTIWEIINRCKQDEECYIDELMEELNYYIENWFENNWLLNDVTGNWKYANLIASFMADYNLSLAGNRDVNYVNGVWRWGAYWTSTPVDDGEGARFFEVEDNVGGILNNQDRYYGQSVRCIANDKPSHAPIALDLFIGWDDIDEDMYLENADWVGRKFVTEYMQINPSELTAISSLPAPDEWMQWTWYLVNNQDGTQKITSSTKVTENTKVYAFLEQKAVQPQSQPIPSYEWSGKRRTWVTKTDEDKTHGSADNQKSETQKENTTEKQNTPKVPEVKPWANLVDNTSTHPSNSHGSATTNTTPAPTYTAEFKSAYSFAKTYWITNKESIQDAKMYTELTRIQMAKMLSQYAINVLGQTPDYSRWVVSFNDVSNKLNKEYDNAVTLAYQLWIMWINMKNNNFRPRDTVTRAEFATALSRMLYWIEDGKWKTKYYEPHIAKLYNEWIINNTNAKMTEKRWYVMTMLMRTVR